MARTAFKTCLHVILVLTSFRSTAQEKKNLDFFYPTDKSTGKGLTLSEFLPKDVPIDQFDDCNCSFGFFYFRVSTTNVVDSIYYESTLGNEKEKIIISNINKTNGHWIFSKNVKKGDKFWISYPYFDLSQSLGKSKNCSEIERTLCESMILISNNINHILHKGKRRNTLSLYIEQRGLGEL